MAKRKKAKKKKTQNFTTVQTQLTFGNVSGTCTRCVIIDILVYVFVHLSLAINYLDFNPLIRIIIELGSY